MAAGKASSRLQNRFREDGYWLNWGGGQATGEKWKVFWYPWEREDWLDVVNEWKKEPRVTIRFGLKNQTEARVPLPRTSEGERVCEDKWWAQGCVRCEVQVRQISRSLSRGPIYTEESGAFIWTQCCCQRFRSSCPWIRWRTVNYSPPSMWERRVNLCVSPVQASFIFVFIFCSHGFPFSDIREHLKCSCSLKELKNISLWLHWVFIAACSLSLAGGQQGLLPAVGGRGLSF